MTTSILCDSQVLTEYRDVTVHSESHLMSAVSFLYDREGVSQMTKTGLSLFFISLFFHSSNDEHNYFYKMNQILTPDEKEQLLKFFGWSLHFLSDNYLSPSQLNNPTYNTALKLVILTTTAIRMVQGKLPFRQKKLRGTYKNLRYALIDFYPLKNSLSVKINKR